MPIGINILALVKAKRCLSVKKLGNSLTGGIVSLRTHYALILSIIISLIAIVIVYWQDFEILANEALHTESSTHIILIPLFTGYLLYKRRDYAAATLQNQQKRIKYFDEVLGLALCLVAFLLYWYGSYTFYPLEYHLLSLPIFIAGITTILFNFSVLRVILFPILFLLFLIPPPTEPTYVVGSLLANFNTHASFTILKSLGLPVTLQQSYGPPTITITTNQPMVFAVDLPCSGIYSLIAFIMFATFLAFITTTSTIKKIGLFALGFTVFTVMNILRITTIIAIGYFFGEEVAMLIFHNIAGWVLILTGMFLTFLFADKLLHIQITPQTQPTPLCPTCSTNSHTQATFCPTCERFTGSLKKPSQQFWAKLLLILLGSTIITFSIHAPTLAIAQGPQILNLGTNLENQTNVFPLIPDYELDFLYRDEDYEKISGQDASLLYAYFPNNSTSPTIYVDVNIATTISNLHNWETCLITWQTSQGHAPLVTVLDSRDTRLLPDTPIIARYLVFESPKNYTQVTLYWYEKAAFHTGLTVEQRYVRLSLIILTGNSTNYPTYEATLLNFGEKIASYWNPLATQSLISLSIPMQQALLTLSIGFVILSKTAEHTNTWRKKSSNLTLFNRFATPTEKRLLQIIQNLNHDEIPATTKQIATTLTNTGNPLATNTVDENLKKLEDNDLIKRDLANVQGYPTLIWKF